MAYATVSDIEARIGRTLNQQETTQCQSLLDEAAVIIDSYNAAATTDSKKTVSIRMVSRAVGCDIDVVPTGATQGSMSALGYTQSWTMGSGGTAGELYIGRTEKKLLGLAGAVGSYSPTQELVPPEVIS